LIWQFGIILALSSKFVNEILTFGINFALVVFLLYITSIS